jgi:hypothetical protein
MGKRQPDGATLHDHLAAAWSASGKQPEEMEAEELPPVVGSVLDVYLQLSATRQASMGPSPINYRDLVAWQQISGVTLTPWEAETILAMDSAVIRIQSEQ